MEKHLIRLLIFTKNIDGGTGTFVLQLFRLEKIIQNLDVQTFCLEVPSYRRISKQKKDDLVFFRSKKFYPHQYKFSFKNIKVGTYSILYIFDKSLGSFFCLSTAIIFKLFLLKSI